MGPMILVALLVAYFGTRRLQNTLAESRRLKAKADRLSVVASRTYNGVLITGAGGMVEWVNDGFTRITGYSFDDVVGRHPDSVLQGPKATPEAAAAKNRARAEGRGFQVEIQNFHKDGRAIWLLIDGQPMKDEKGKVTGYVVMQVDITKRKEEEEEIRVARAAAEEANRAKSSFLANMSHELRTPLNAIIGYTEMLIEKARFTGNDDNLRDLEKVEAAGNHLLGLINDVLDLSKIEAGKMSLYLEEFSIPEMIAEVQATIEPLVERNGNELIVECSADLGAMRADVTKVRQTLFNLLSNAAKFTHEGAVRLRVGAVDTKGEQRAGERVR
jgi:PAS domain S-box-containing protein